MYSYKTPAAPARQEDSYTELAKAIWNPEKIKEIAGGWEDAEAVIVQSGNGKRYTVEYGDGRSWQDARKFGFVSACSNGNNLLCNINVGDFIFCHIAGRGFVLSLIHI